MTTGASNRLNLDRIAIPPLPAIVAKLDAMLQDSRTGMREIGEVLEKDGHIAGRVLKVANSVAFGMSEPLLAPSRATAVLGLRLVRTIVLEASILKLYDNLAKFGCLDLQALWRHSLFVAQMGRDVSTRSGLLRADGDALYICGLLHEVGKLILLDNSRDAYAALIQRAIAQELPLYRVEEETLHATHAHVSAIVVSRWGLPSDVAAVIRAHHNRPQQLQAQPKSAAVALCDRVCARIEDGSFTGLGPNETILAVACGLDAKRAGDFVERAQTVWPTIDN
jgi:putative nucleotidyltransferase with HDIG domain